MNIFLQLLKNELIDCGASEGAKEALCRITASYNKLASVALYRKPKFTVDNSQTKNPFYYTAGGLSVSFHYYDISSCGKFARLLNSDKVSVATVQKEALEELVKLVEPE